MKLNDSDRCAKAKTVPIPLRSNKRIGGFSQHIFVHAAAIIDNGDSRDRSVL
jgi:hypothetical protein